MNPPPLPDDLVRAYHHSGLPALGIALDRVAHDPALRTLLALRARIARRNHQRQHAAQPACWIEHSQQAEPDQPEQEKQP